MTQKQAVDESIFLKLMLVALNHLVGFLLEKEKERNTEPVKQWGDAPA